MRPLGVASVLDRLSAIIISSHSPNQVKAKYVLHFQKDEPEG